MKSTTIKIPGFTDDTRPKDRPAVCVFGVEGSGKTRFAVTMPGPIGVIPLDKKSRRTVDLLKKELGVQVLMPDHEYITDEQIAKVALLDTENPSEKKELMEIYTKAVEAVRQDIAKLAKHPQVESICVDTFDRLWDWILFSHFGRKNQIETFQRGAPNQDAIDLINLSKTKNLSLLCTVSEVWKDSGEVDGKGRKKQEPSGKFKPSGFGKVGHHCTAVIEMQSKLRMANPDEKFNVLMKTCQTNSMLEGFTLNDYGLVGDAISWDNLMAVIGMSED